MKEIMQFISDKIKEEKYNFILLSSFCFFFLFFCSKMSLLYPTNDWSDVNVYFNVAKGMLDGRILYTEVFDHKGPLIFLIYALGAFISSSTFIGVFLILFIFWSLFAISIYSMARIYLPSLYSLLVTSICIYLSTSYLWMGGSAEEFILIFEGISLFLFFKFFTDRAVKHNPYAMAVHGVLVASVFFIKLSIILFWFFPLLGIFLYLLFNKQYKNILVNLLGFFIGVAIVSLPILLYFVYHDAFREAYHVYIELNKQYSSSDDYLYLITNGFSKLYTNIREHLALSILYLIGIFYAPFRLIKNKLFSISVLLSGLSLIGMVFFNLTFHFYYPLVLLVFTALGLVCVFSFFVPVLKSTNRIGFRYGVVSLLIVLILCIGSCNFFQMGTGELLRTSIPSGPEFKFRKYLLESKESTLLNLSFGSGNALFTTSEKIPSVKYFFSPNIYYDMYPNVRDAQTQYIENKSVDFIISSSEGFNYDYFKDLEILKENYQIIDSTRWINADYYLYKKK